MYTSFKKYFLSILFVLLIISSCTNEEIIPVSSSSSSNSSSSSLNPFAITENGTNYIPIFTERWSNQSPESQNIIQWSANGSWINRTTLSGTISAYEGNSAWQIIYNNDIKGWWGFCKAFVVSPASTETKRVEMNSCWNWNITFRIKGSPVSSTNVRISIQSGIYNDSPILNDVEKTSWMLADLGYTGTGDWETITTNFSTSYYIEWDKISILFMMTSEAGAIGSDTLVVDDIYWWIESADYGLPNANASYNQTALAINTVPDSSYDITYEQTKFVPPSGKVLLLTAYDRVNVPLHFSNIGIAGGYGSVIAIHNNDGITNDLNSGGDNIQNTGWMAETYTNIATQVGLWMVGVAKYGVNYSANTVAGDYDINIDTFCNWAKTANIPIYLHIGYEFDGTHNMFEPAEYKSAYQYIVDRIRANNVSNVAFVWHSWADTPYNGYSLSDLYPGDSYVDWVGISIYDHQFVNGIPGIFLNKVIDFARDKKKPVIISESTPIGGINPGDYRTWNQWFATVFSFIYEKNIKAFTYVSADFSQVPQFPTWGNTRIQEFPLIKTEWITEISKSRYLKQSPTLFSDLGF